MRITETKESQPFETTHEWLRGHNEKHVSADWSALRLLAHDDEGDLVGSLDGEVFWGKLHVSNIVVKPELKRRGIGSALMQAAEGEAKRSGCSGVYLDTMSFQALEFYLHLGFTQAGEVPGFQNESTMYFLHKAI